MEPVYLSDYTGYEGGQPRIVPARCDGTETAPLSIETAVRLALEGGGPDLQCAALFAFPAQLLDIETGEGLACLCHTNGETRIVFVIFDAAERQARIFEESEVSESLAGFAWSCGRMLSHLGEIDQRRSTRMH